MLFNVTITATVNAGFLGVAPGDATEVQAPTVNWGASGQSIANGSMSTLDDARQLAVFCGGVGSSQFIIDITGYTE